MRRSAGGDVLTGMLKAESMVLATQIVREMGGVPVDIVRVGDEAVEKKGFLGLDLGAITNRISSRDILTFTSQLAVCMHSVRYCLSLSPFAPVATVA